MSENEKATTLANSVLIKMSNGKSMESKNEKSPTSAAVPICFVLLNATKWDCAVINSK
jgi:hypothetical protein